MSDAITISGTPVVLGLNGTHFLLDASTTGTNRVWGNAAQMRIYYEDGWKIANSADGTVYFYQVTPSPIDPWDIPTAEWDTDIEAYKTRVADMALIRTEDEEKTDVVTYSSMTYSLTKDTLFLAGKDYYLRVGKGTDENPYVYVKTDVEPGAEVTPGIYYEGFMTDVVKTTTLNVRTGKVVESIVESKVSQFPVQVIHDRYATPDLETGKVYRFSFVSDFKALGYIKPQANDYSEDEAAENDSDITRGIYQIESVTNYYNLITKGVDIYQNLYVPLGLSRAVYEKDAATWKDNDIWYRLMNPMLPAQVYYVPTSIIEGIPDGNVTEYKRMHLVVDIGIFNDPELLSNMVTSINMLMKAHFGIPTSAELAAYDSVWIPTSYYDWLEGQRQSNKHEFMSTQADQFYNTLFKTEYNKIHNENNTLRSQVNAYEEIIHSLVNGN